MKYCSKCGACLDDEAAFCTRCGAPVASMSTTQPYEGRPAQPYADPAQSYAPRFTAPQGQTAQPNYPPSQPQAAAHGPSTIQTIAEIFMIISCVAGGWALIPLCWMLPMTISYSRAIKEGREVSTAFKVCTLIFVNLISGILMLVSDDLKD